MSDRMPPSRRVFGVLPSPWAWLLVAASALLFWGCGETASTRADTDTSPDSDLISTPDVTPDVGADADARDIRDEAPADTIVFDVPLEVTPDLGDMPADIPADMPPPPPPEPLRVAFVGNSFTFGGPIPTMVHDLAVDAGWPEPEMDRSTFGGETLQGHRGRPETLAMIDAGDWDVVVLQENSIRPTDGLGNPDRFKQDATWFYDRIRESSPGARVILYETWARHPDHGYYPGSFANPAEMQAQLRFHYNDAADVYIPANATQPPGNDVEVSPVGDAWEHHLAQPAALRLHHTDDWHANDNGQYLNALVIYGTIYHRSVQGLTPLDVAPGDAAFLQTSADETTGETVPGGPDGMGVPTGLLVGEQVHVDFGDVSTSDVGWSNISDAIDGGVFNVPTSADGRSSVDVFITDGFSGANSMGGASNGLGYPDTAGSDTVWTGVFTTHTEALTRLGQVTVGGLDPSGRYDLRLFASRTGTDGGRGRLTRYSVGGQWLDLEVADNTDSEVEFVSVQPDAFGQLVVDVTISPDGTGRFAYIGVLELERRAP